MSTTINQKRYTAVVDCLDYKGQPRINSNDKRVTMRIGSAFLNKAGGLNVKLDALPPHGSFTLWPADENDG